MLWAAWRAWVGGDGREALVWARWGVVRGGGGGGGWWWWV